jgi:hypothetical protein
VVRIQALKEGVDKSTLGFSTDLDHTVTSDPERGKAVCGFHIKHEVAVMQE